MKSVRADLAIVIGVALFSPIRAISEERLSMDAVKLPAAVAEGPLRTGAARIPVMDKLVIDPCTAAVPLGKATLRVSGMSRKGGVYTGSYQMKVTPLFFASEKGRIAVAVSDENLRKLIRGAPIEFSGTTTTTGSGKTRAVNGIATPLGKTDGRMQMWFTADGKKKAFTSNYRFLEK